MAFTITGGKYALQTLTAVGTNTVTVNSGVPFVVNDFAGIARIAALYSPAGSTNYLTNGTFDTDTVWTKGAGVTISGGVANASGAANILGQNVALTVGNYYLVTLSYTKTAGVNLRFSNNTSDTGTYRVVLPMPAASGTLTFAFRAERNGLYIAADAAVFTGTIDNVSIVDASQLKGIAYVRRATSTTQLELESAFFDPVDGATKTQAIGDNLLISKTWAECDVTGWASSNGTTTLSDTVTIGSPGLETSACIYDEYKTLVSTAAGSTITAAMSHVGGVFVSGHLQDWAAQRFYGSCNFVTRQPGNGMFQVVQGSGAHLVQFGGQRSNPTSQIVWEPANLSTDVAKTLVWMGVETANGILSTNSGQSAWMAGTESRMCFFNCTSVIPTGNGIAWRPANAVVQGGSAKITGTVALSVFGSGYNGFAIGASSGQRFVVSDVNPGSYGGQPTALWDQAAAANSSTVNFTNVWSPISNVIRWAASTVTFNWRWRGAYQNLASGTLIQILKSDGATTEVSTTTTGSKVDLTVLSHTQSGANVQTLPVTYNNASWTWAAWLYGYLPISGSFSQQTVSLGTAGSTTDVSHGGIFSQTTDTSITQASVETVAAYTAINNLDALYDYSIYWKALNTTNMKWQGIGNRTFAPNGATLEFANSVVVDSAASSAYSPNTGTNVLTLKSSNLVSGGKFTALQASSITVAAATTVTCALSGAVTLNGTLGSGAAVTGNVAQATPASMNGVTINGNLTYNTNSNVTVTLTNCQITGTVSNSGTGTVTIALSGSTVAVLGTRVVAKPATLTFTGLAVGSRVVVYNAGTMSETAVASSSSVATTTGYTVGTTLTYRVFDAASNPLSGSVTLSAAGVNTVAVSQAKADGIGGSATVRSINGTTINAGGSVSIDTSAKTISFESAVDIRAALTAIQTAWVSQSALYSQDIGIPFSLESVSGLMIRDDWTVINPDNSNREGYALFNPATEELSQINLNFITELNDADVKVNLVYDGVDQPSITVPGEQDRLFINVDPASSNIAIRSLLKRQDIQFIDRLEQMRSGQAWARFFRNYNTIFSQTIDTYVTALLPRDDSKYRLIQSTVTPPADNNGTTHTFSRVIEVETGTQDRASLINQLAAVATFDDYYRAKPYSVNANGKIVMETGTWVRQRNGSPLLGNAAALLVLSSAAGEYIQPEIRLLSIKLDDKAVYGCNYVVYRKSTGAILVDASGQEITGTLTTASRSALIAVQASSNIDVVVATVAEGVAETFTPVTMTSGTSSVVITTSTASVVAPAVSQTISDPATGVLSWNSIIDDATFDPVTKDIIIPTQVVAGSVVKSYNLVYLYFAWRRWIIQDVRRMRYGWAISAEHQLAPPGSVDMSYKFQPGIAFNDGWALNVSATRSTSDIVRIEASNISRRDTLVNSGLVYRSPLANGATTMAEVVIAGAATETIRNAYAQSVQNAIDLANLKANEIATIQSNLSVINTGVKKASLLVPHTGDIT